MYILRNRFTPNFMVAQFKSKVLSKLNVAGIWSHFKWLTQRCFAMKFSNLGQKAAVSVSISMMPAISSSITSKWHYIRMMMLVNITYHHVTPKLFLRPWYRVCQRFNYCVFYQVLVSVLTLARLLQVQLEMHISGLRKPVRKSRMLNMRIVQLLSFAFIQCWLY